MSDSSDPMDCSLPGSSIHGIFQAKVRCHCLLFRLFIFLGSKITADGDCSHEIKRHLLLGRKVMTNLESILEKTMAPHSSTLAWKIPWTEEPGRLQSVGSLSRTRLSDFTFTLGKEMATHSSVLAWRIPGTGEPGGLPSLGSHRVGHD